jgi:di/tricarboxylate transporter
MTLYVVNTVAPEAYAVAVPFIEKVRNALAADIQLGANCEHCMPVTAPAPFYEGPGGITYGDKEHLGIIFHVIVKENESGDFPVAA